ncbi:MAG: SPOR domain-containing protein [Pseudomonadota bacterium]
MPKPISDEELQFRVRARRRVLGAIALVVIAVVLLPMILDSQPKRDGQDISVNIPRPDKAPPFNPPLKPVAPNKIAKSTVNEPAPFVADVKPVPVREPVNAVTKSSPTEIKPLTEAKPVEKPAEKTVEKTKAPETTKPTENKKAPDAVKLANAKPSKFVVQLGVFSNPENAQLVEGRLKENQIRHYREMLKSPPGSIRVRAGPYPTRKDAETTLAQLRLAGITGGVVISE